ncbi:hypothetical protein VTL71DRAFT_3787 [Oculimacula yallundae]|uniref:Uncharacterized protein n=1 Tax=Oculimacula yallundae TaxID=86028 RepID=A0ABR4C412_9HELO
MLFVENTVVARIKLVSILPMHVDHTSEGEYWKSGLLWTRLRRRPSVFCPISEIHPSITMSEQKGSNDGGLESVPKKSEDDVRTDGIAGEIDHIRLTELMQALQRIAKLQREVAWSQSISQQKVREAAFKRRDVWIRDANFMTEIQRLVAEGKLAGQERLLYLASQCQASRDGLGQLEQEAVDTEQEWHGHSWKLRQAEIGLYSEFEREFAIAESYPARSSSALSSTSGFSSDLGSQEQDFTTGQMIYAHQAAASATSTASIKFNAAGSVSSTKSGNSSHNSILPNTEQNGARRESDAGSDTYTDLDSGIENIDGPIFEEPRPALVKCFSEQHPRRKSPTIKMFPQLLVDFGSRRDRINKWLEDIILDSRLEATSIFSTLQARLSLEHKEVPSNWSQLVIAFWEQDEASTPCVGRKVDSTSIGNNTCQPVRPNFGNVPVPEQRHNSVENHKSSSEVQITVSHNAKEQLSSSTSFNSLGFDYDNVMPSPPLSHEHPEFAVSITGKDSHD